MGTRRCGMRQLPHAVLGQSAVARLVSPLLARLLPGRADHVTDPLARLLVHRACDAVLLGSAVSLDLLEHHLAQSGEYSRSNHRQQYGFRFLRHPAILLTAGTAGQSPPSSFMRPGAPGPEYGVRRRGR